MKKLLLVFFWIPTVLMAQEEDSEAPAEGWTSSGSIQLLFNQAAFNKEWTGGGTSSIAGNFNLDYELNYHRGHYSWNNKVLATYGLTRVKGDAFTRKTSDRLEINSIVGREIQNSSWHYSFFSNFRTQFSKGYEYTEDPETGQILRRETTRFISPAYLQAGPGMMWKKSEDFMVNLAPATARIIFVNPVFTTDPLYEDGSYYGVEKGESSRFELGASLSTLLKLKLMENVSLENSLNLYSNYLSKPGNIDIDYLLNLDMAINKFLSANLVFQAVYDDNIVGAFQIREVFGAGLNYSF